MNNTKTLLYAGVAAAAMLVGQASATPFDFDVPPPSGWIFNLAGHLVPINPGRYVEYAAHFNAAQTTSHITFALSDSTFDAFFLDNITVTDTNSPSNNLVQNGGFEDGIAASGGNPNAPVDWQYLNPYGVFYRSFLWCGGDGYAGVGQNGSDCAWTPGFDQSYDFITQPIATVIGDEYQLSFWALGPDEGNHWIERNGAPCWPETEGDSFDIIAYAGSIPDLTVRVLPEPADLGMFGFGLLLIGGFVALRPRGQWQA